MSLCKVLISVSIFLLVTIELSECSERCGMNSPLRCPYGQKCFKYQKKSECTLTDGSESRARTKEDADNAGKCPRAPNRPICIDVEKVCKEVRQYKDRSANGTQGYPSEVPYIVETSKGSSRNGEAKKVDSQEKHIISDLCHGPVEVYQPPTKGTSSFCNDGGCSRHDGCKVVMPGDIALCCEGACAHVSNLQAVRGVFEKKDQICPS